MYHMINVKWELDYMDFMLPSLTLQPMVENAVRHGITKRREGGTLHIQSMKAAGEVRLTVSDDGISFDTSAVFQDGENHIGIENVKKRLETQCGGTLQIHSVPGKGTKVEIILPQQA